MADGFLNLLKPPGMTSHDLVQAVRRIGGGKVGHTGTLDPAAAGVLVLSLGRATRLSQYVQQLPKSYRAEFTLGLATDSGDAEGIVTAVSDHKSLSQERLREALSHLTGELSMAPPAYSAVRVRGRRAYELAREGVRVQPAPRTVEIYRMELLAFECGPLSQVLVDLDCSSGTYVRVLADMFGQQLEASAYLSALVRTAVGSFSVDQTVSLAELEQDGVNRYLICPAEGLAHMPAVTVERDRLRAVQHGNRIEVEEKWPLDTLVRVLNPARSLVAVGMCLHEQDTFVIQPRTVLPPTASDAHR